MRKTFFLLLCMFFFIFDLSCNAIYRLNFEGLKNDETLVLLQSTSQLYLLQDTPPVTKSALKRRAESDIPSLIEALHSLALFNARVSLQINEDAEPVEVTFKIDEGPVYPISAFSWISKNDSEAFKGISVESLGIKIGDPAFPRLILLAEENLINALTRKGYPLVRIVQREVLVDQQTKSVQIFLYVDSGPLCSFGKVQFIGQEKVSPTFLERKVAWISGEAYNPSKIEQTQAALDGTGLFSAVLIEQNATDSNQLPITIQVLENKHRSVGFGIGYATQRGAGVAAEWENRNMRGMGEKLSFRTNLWQDKQKATLLYLMPDSYAPKQDLIWLAEYEHEKTLGYTQLFYSLSGIVENRISANLRSSIGGTFKHLRDSRSDNNRGFNLAKIPVQIHWNNINSLLDPICGHTLHFKTVPTLQLFNPRFAYSINTLVGTYYQPLTDNQKVVFAGKVVLGSIFGAKYDQIPTSERFYSGTENTLRGYRYMTVSPLNDDHKPRGGRSMAICSLETRFRASESFGFVAFYEIGNVYENCFPNFRNKVLQSAGTGLRYHTAVGPLRFDVAFPINRRKHVDAPFQIYMSIGQAF